MSSQQRIEELQRALEKKRVAVSLRQKDLAEPPPGSKRVPMQVGPNILIQRRLEFLIESLLPIECEDLGIRANRLELECNWQDQLMKILDEGQKMAEKTYEQATGSRLIMAGPDNMPQGFDPGMFKRN